MTRINSLYGPSTCRCVHAKQRDYLRFFSKQTSAFWIRITSLYGSQTSPVVLCMQNSFIMTGINSLYGSKRITLYGSHLSLCACKTTRLTSELLVCMGPSLQAGGFCMQNCDFMTRITSLYGSQTSPVVLCMQNSFIINSLYGSKTSPVVVCMQNNEINI